jgi:hypothetical protein
LFNFRGPVKRIISIAAVLFFVALTYFLILQFSTPKNVVSDNNNVPGKTDKPVKNTNTENDKVKEDKADLQVPPEKNPVTSEKLATLKRKIILSQ